jgi:hypothetical protein
MTSCAIDDPQQGIPGSERRPNASLASACSRRDWIWTASGFLIPHPPALFQARLWSPVRYRRAPSTAATLVLARWRMAGAVAGAAKTRPPAATPPCLNPHNNPYGIGEGIKGWLSKTERAHRREVEFVAMERLLALRWAILDRHFQYQIRLVGHFKEVGPAAVIRMWRTQTNKDGKRLSHFERDALKERYCELFGTWPQ